MQRKEEKSQKNLYTVYPDRPRVEDEYSFFKIIVSSEDSYLPQEMNLTLIHLNTCILEETIHIASHTRSYVHTIVLEELPVSHNGIGLGIELSSSSYSCSTAIDIGTGPIRYGFVSDFSSEDKERHDEKVEYLLKNHITHVQFYDWAYRPHQASPEQENISIYEDSMGKVIDLSVIKDLIEKLHMVGIKALAYGAVYAALKEYLDAYPEQALYDIDGNTFNLIETFFIMNLASKGWRDNIIKQYTYAVDTLNFDGIHMDTYGYPKSGWGYQDTSLHSLEEDFVSFINEWATCGNENIFNNVGGWPASTTSQAEQAACYIEVWDPHTRYHHLKELIYTVLPKGKPVILAAYLLPFKQRDIDKNKDSTYPVNAALLLIATVSSLGATSLLIGESGVVLTQPYYSDYTMLSVRERDILQSYYDFQVRYRELLYDSEATDITESHAMGENREIGIHAGTYPVSHDGRQGTLWAIVKRHTHRISIQLINLIDQNDDEWNTDKLDCMTAPQMRITIPQYSKTMRVYTSAPEINHGRAVELETRYGYGVRGPSIIVEVPSVGIWRSLWCDLI